MARKGGMADDEDVVTVEGGVVEEGGMAGAGDVTEEGGVVSERRVAGVGRVLGKVGVAGERGGMPLYPLLCGGGQERGYRPG